ncbi:MAG: ISL3 family transposase, partial [Elusimicrobiota bacterium]
LAKMMPVKAVSRLTGETDNRIWRVIEHYVDEARKDVNLSEVEHMGMDETATKKGHNYVTIFVDMDKRRAIDVEEGKKADVVEKFVEDFKEHEGEPKKITDICCDMSVAFIKGIEDNFKEPAITFDRYHVMKIMNKAVNDVRIREAKEQSILNKTKYIWLKNYTNLSAKQESKLKEIIEIKNLNLHTVRAYHIRENFKQFYEVNNKKKAEELLKKWFWWATHSRIEEMREVAWTIKRHWKGVLNWHENRISNGLLEGLNSLFQAAKAKARGYRSLRKIRTVIYLLMGKLEFELPKVLPT